MSKKSQAFQGTWGELDGLTCNLDGVLEDLAVGSSKRHNAQAEQTHAALTDMGRAIRERNIRGLQFLAQGGQCEGFTEELTEWIAAFNQRIAGARAKARSA